MRLYRQLVREVDRPLALAIGFFDGLHRGHRVLIDEARRLRKPRWRVGVLTFENHPAAFLRPGTEPPLICTPEERIRLFAEAGIEECFFIPFDAHLAYLSPEQFMKDVLLKQLGVRGVVVGSTFRFGYQRAGDAEMMANFFTNKGTFVAVPPVADETARISSTRIRNCITAGDTEGADRLLGQSYELSGIVERGAGRGHTLGFPTANIVPPQKILPKDGVYSATARFDGRDYAALVSIGTNPTFGKNARMIEAWLRDFRGTIYGRELRLRDLRFVREQRTFTTADELATQMIADRAEVAYPLY